jgi:cyclic pyranopterin monophosphate synthase
MTGLTHFDGDGHAHMVDVSGKPVTDRIAIARGQVRMSGDTLALVAAGRAKKGDVLAVARLAGIMGAKRTADLIPLCHPLPITKVAIDLTLDSILPGVRMEALTAVSVAALTIYDMLKAADKAMVIEGIALVLKDGGKSGRYEAT